MEETSIIEATKLSIGIRDDGRILFILDHPCGCCATGYSTSLEDIDEIVKRMQTVAKIARSVGGIPQGSA